ncbi:hypothetical protein [Vibrio sp. B181a]|uniref:hypothetical protein n=1 Tax=Vibrio sp. B181a TaxID=2835906 RepID=UPI0025524ACC|nr:hypothetical protein [Vibrio sp. B181a]MDK9774476.1 hypothetical protein [Vibrio sp. B181a]
MVSQFGCVQTQSEDEIRNEFNLYRPALVMTYQVANDTRVNNHLAIKEGLDARLKGRRQVVVVSRIGGSEPDVAMERAKKTALLLDDMGEDDPRMYIRQARRSDKEKWDNGAVELYVFPIDKWDDQAFVRLMNTQSIEVAALGGVLRSDVARISLSEVFMRKINTPSSDISDQLYVGLKQVGWKAITVNMPKLQGQRKRYVLSLPESGIADEQEAIAFAKLIAKQVNLNNIEVLVDARNNTLTLGYKLIEKKPEQTWKRK